MKPKTKKLKIEKLLIELARCEAKEGVLCVAIAKNRGHIADIIAKIEKV